MLKEEIPWSIGSRTMCGRHKEIDGRVSKRAHCRVNELREREVSRKDIKLLRGNSLAQSDSVYQPADRA